jgi:hypothetical protein
MHGTMSLKPIVVYTVLRLLMMDKTCRVLYQNKVEKQCILLASVVQIYHDAQSSECESKNNVKNII